MSEENVTLLQLIASTTKKQQSRMPTDDVDILNTSPNRTPAIKKQVILYKIYNVSSCPF